MGLNLKKPLAFFDLETTGTNITNDRIVEISVLKVMPNNEQIIKTTRINPTIPIPLESSLIHGIYDEDVKDKPTFKSVAAQFATMLQGCDLAGFNILRFDVPVLVEEFLRAGVDFDITNRKMVDAQRIYHLMEPRNLSAAYKYYCNKDLEGAHSAEADTIATFEVLKAQILKYEGCTIKDGDGKEFIPVKNDMNALHELTASQFVDLAGRMVLNDKGEEVFNFGKYKNMKVTDVLQKDPSYYDWMMKGDFALSTKKKLTEIKLRKFNHKV
ncbi:DNA polymerase III subunit epsilon [Sporocytophaga myxococcoides]|uniref:DNA polymerase III subunit epsilon n=1 Tax=Sporocytophaga myxococcoides TaxID=153721 RepID=A0A098L946_9BACT|nr:3'-5' exonuclease [Sporocytophaga myxococcoides]GAL83395.1 DNA polymerase III subunit epsilon [Sporocytophaga myxococcoides]